MRFGNAGEGRSRGVHDGSVLSYGGCEIGVLIPLCSYPACTDIINA